MRHQQLKVGYHLFVELFSYLPWKKSLPKNKTTNFNSNTSILIEYLTNYFFISFNVVYMSWYSGLNICASVHNDSSCHHDFFRVSWFYNTLVVKFSNFCETVLKWSWKYTVLHVFYILQFLLFNKVLKRLKKKQN